MDAAESRTAGKPRFCPECGAGLGETDAFCGGCGSAIAGTAPIAAPIVTAALPENAAQISRMFDRATFGAALTLGSVWAILNARRGSLRWGWLCLLGALPATVVVWTSLYTVYRNLTMPYAVLVGRDSLHEIVLLALFTRAVLTLPMALDAARRPEARPHPQKSGRNLGLAGLAAIFAILGLDLATDRARTRASADDLATKVRATVRYNGRHPDDPTRGGYTVRVTGPRLLPLAAVAMRLYVRDDAHTGEFGFDAGLRSGPYGSNVDEYTGDQEITFVASGPSPTYALYIAGRVAARGDLQPKGKR